MKKKKSGFFALGIALFSLTLISCSPTSTITTAKFTSIDRIFNLKLNTSLNEVVTVLETEPYNVLSSQIDGYTIYSYKYKLIEREIDPKFITKRGNESTGEEVYNADEHDLFLFFKDGLLQSYITTEGRQDSPVLINLNSNIYALTLAKGEYKFIEFNTPEKSSGFRLGSKSNGKKKFFGLF
ncbi:MAG: hypothetical protein PHU97_04450 [Bacteroidales bacterium]|nr:hypothetical protein [Bacteroidales bacterium]MDY0286434.1 hypothetical protein [Bacteroidales bacterium]HPE87043.1 hypothetical protein [Bacteroidales bacterium]